MRARINENIGASSVTQQDGADINRSSPLMETLGGFAIAAGLMYGGYSVVALGATRAVLFLPDGLSVGYEPAKRLARSTLS